MLQQPFLHNMLLRTKGLKVFDVALPLEWNLNGSLIVTFGKCWPTLLLKAFLCSAFPSLYMLVEALTVFIAHAAHIVWEEIQMGHQKVNLQRHFAPKLFVWMQ